MSHITKLKEKREQYYQELEELHLYEPSPEYYMMRRHEIEHEIACIEEAIEIEQTMKPFKWTLYGFIVVAIGLLIWAYVASK
jgi:hypothetical protein